MNVVDLPGAVQQDAVAFLEALVSDLKIGRVPAVERGVIMLNYTEGGYSCWNFGPKGGGMHMTASLFAIGQQLCLDELIGP